MGSMIYLAVGRLEIDWGKNNSFTDHSPLFQIHDIDNVPYHYVGEELEHGEHGNEEKHRWEIITEFKKGLKKPLAEVVDRIRLLGYTSAWSEKEFIYLSNLNGFETNRFTFNQLREALGNVDVNSLLLEYGDGNEDFGEFFLKQIYPCLGFPELPPELMSELRRFGDGMENLSAYTVIQLLAENPTARNLPVICAFNDVEEGGWAMRSEFVRPLDPSNRFLIVTEGSSDVAIIRHAFQLLKPHIADFFNYADMAEGYPFSGTGNLYRFIQGLISIGIMNNIIVIFDNDAEGVASFNRCRKLNIPNNMRILRLPDHPQFYDFETIGPNGKNRANINGQGAAIECYLDLRDEYLIRWKNFNSDSGNYQGELIGKDRYKKEFLDQRKRIEDYNYSKIKGVLEMIINNCEEMREEARIKELELLT